MNNQIASDAWGSYLKIVEDSREAIDKIMTGKPMGLLLNQYIHALVWHKGVCIARWIIENKDLVRKLNNIKRFSDEEFSLISREVSISINKLSRY